MKPFMEIADLVTALDARGLQVGDHSAAETYLRKIGYFRSGAYRYVFRQMLPPHQQDARHRQFRSDTYVAGASLADVKRLEEFDSRLRNAFLVGLSDFEVRLRASIAHVLARRNVAAHTDRQFLDALECSVKSGSGTKFDAWVTTFEDAIQQSRDEDFVAHQILKYGHPLPVWAVIEVLSFGSLPYLFDLLKVDDRREVAKAFGVQHEAKFSAWVRAFCDMRNYCAHGTRVFNRITKRAVRLVPAAYVGQELDHLTTPNFTTTPDAARRVYSVASVLAHVLKSHEAGSGWNLTFKTCMRKFPQILTTNGQPLVSAEGSMGFPSNWTAFDLWS